MLLGENSMSSDADARHWNLAGGETTSCDCDRCNSASFLIVKDASALGFADAWKVTKFHAQYTASFKK